jgi:hypothetical protein
VSKRVKLLQLLENKVLTPLLLLSRSHDKLRLGKDRVRIVDKGTYGVSLILRKLSFFSKDAALEMSFLMKRMFIRVSKKFTASLAAVNHAPTS